MIIVDSRLGLYFDVDKFVVWTCVLAWTSSLFGRTSLPQSSRQITLICLNRKIVVPILAKYIVISNLLIRLILLDLDVLVQFGVDLLDIDFHTLGSLIN